MNGWMALICLLASVWMIARAVAGCTFEPREVVALGIILLVAATKFFAVWAKELGREDQE